MTLNDNICQIVKSGGNSLNSKISAVLISKRRENNGNMQPVAPRLRLKMSYPEGDFDNTPLSAPRSGAGGRDRAAASASRPLGAIAWPPSGTGKRPWKACGWSTKCRDARLHRAGANAHGRLSFGNSRTRSAPRSGSRRFNRRAAWMSGLCYLRI
jgi:hypothetical protein